MSRNEHVEYGKKRGISYEKKIQGNLLPQSAVNSTKGQTTGNTISYHGIQNHDQHDEDCTDNYDKHFRVETRKVSHSRNQTGPSRRVGHRLGSRRGRDVGIHRR